MSKEPTAAEYEKAATEKWQAELLRRLEAGEHLNKADKKEALKLKKQKARLD